MPKRDYNKIDIINKETESYYAVNFSNRKSLEEDKTYEGIIKLGEKTDSMDLTGNVVEEKKITEISDQSLIDCENKFS